MTDPRTDAPTEIAEDSLDTATGGFETWPAKWKGFSLDGKGTDVAMEEITLVHEAIRRAP